jgi:hypothetical protein
MIARGYGRIVNVTSIAGKEGNPMAAAYSASKAAVIARTKAIGKDVARTGVLIVGDGDHQGLHSLGTPSRSDACRRTLVRRGSMFWL